VTLTNLLAAFLITSLRNVFRVSHNQNNTNVLHMAAQRLIFSVFSSVFVYLPYDNKCIVKHCHP